jgi:hypothetical protein
LTIYTDGFRCIEPLEEDDAFDREYTVHGDSEYADDEVHISTRESHRDISRDKLAQCLRAFQLRRELFGKPSERLSSTPFERRCEINNVVRVSDWTKQFSRLKDSGEIQRKRCVNSGKDVADTLNIRLKYGTRGFRPKE